MTESIRPSGLRKAWPLIAAAVALSLAAGAVGALSYHELGDRPGACDAQRLAAKVQPSLVAITSPTAGFRGNGIIIQPDGVILTRASTIASPSPTVLLPNGVSMPATVVGTDPVSDLAVISVAATQLPATPLSWTEELKPGEPLTVLGSPLAPEAMITSGLVGATNQTLRTRFPIGEVSLPDLIRLDAPLSAAVDAGAVMNCDGQLVGIALATQVDPGQNVAVTTAAGDAISAAYARRISQALINHQTPTHPWFGMSLAPISTDLAARYRTTGGLYVATVDSDQPAHQAGILAGDVITAINGRTANSTSWSQLLLTVAVGEHVQIDLVRNGTPQQVTVPVAEAPAR
ncbi:MAG: S1C family serine protease [Propionibacteriales bacterium]|nr:S1C family serine protease [Propionibacteriales bacterium]